MAKKHKHPEHVNHERWLVSYADFITLLFATFVALYALSRTDVNKAAAAAESMRISFNAANDKIIPQEALDLQAIPTNRPKPIPGDTSFPTPRPRREAGREQFEEIKKEVEEFLITKAMLQKVSVEIQERGLVVSLKEAGFFESGKAEVRGEAYQVVQEIAQKISQYRNPVRIEGHSDNVPISSRTYPTNWELSSARAVNMARLLTDRFRVPPDKISATGYGEHRPVSDNNTPAGRARNRRVDLVILSSIAERSEPEATSIP